MAGRLRIERSKQGFGDLAPPSGRPESGAFGAQPETCALLCRVQAGCIAVYACWAKWWDRQDLNLRWGYCRVGLRVRYLRPLGDGPMDGARPVSCTRRLRVTNPALRCQSLTDIVELIRGSLGQHVWLPEVDSNHRMPAFGGLEPHSRGRGIFGANFAFVVGMTGFEPVAPCTRGTCSDQTELHSESGCSTA